MDSTPEEKLLDLIKKGRSKAMFGKELKIFKKINIILIGIIAIVAIIFLSDVFIFKEEPLEKPAVDMQIETSKVQPVANDAIEEKMPDVSNINEEIKKVSKEGIVANLNLLGIITGENNQAIIEDKTLKKTFFLYKGDTIDGLTVYDIKDSEVILDYNGERIELKI